MITAFLSILFGGYCGTMYYLFRHFLIDALTFKAPDYDWKDKLRDAAIFLAAPISLPLLLLIGLLAHSH